MITSRDTGLSTTGTTNTPTATFTAFNSQFKAHILGIVFVGFGGVTATSPTSNTSCAVYGRVGRVLGPSHTNIHNAGEMAPIGLCSVWFANISRSTTATSNSNDLTVNQQC